jgi:hypothetical protein
VKLSFIETMRGAVVDADGRRHTVDFQVRAVGENGRFSLAGVVHAGGFADEAPCEGTLTITAIPASIAYVVRFAGRDGETLTLEGAKTPSPWSPLRSMTQLPIALRAQDGRALAEGELAFDLFDLPEFVSSWLPLPSVAARRFDARRTAVERRALYGG